MPATPSGPTRKRAPSGIGAPGHTAGGRLGTASRALSGTAVVSVSCTASCSAALDTCSPPAARGDRHRKGARGVPAAAPRVWSSPLFCPRGGPHSRFPRPAPRNKQVASDNGLGGWSLNRTRWKAGPALRRGPIGSPRACPADQDKDRPAGPAAPVPRVTR
ncbi:hypothetical protein GCM10010207_00190 [Streptomyces atratus]|nr:hypothetical protein GCM10010207_00190 [Streptomyces atratus]